MAETELPLALTLLRSIRGWTQDALEKASGVPSSSISDYERGKKTPTLKTLDRLTAAMGFSIRSIERTQRFINAMRSEAFMDDIENWPAPEEGAAASPDAAVGSASPAALHWELEQIAAEAGQVVTRLARMTLVLMSRAATIPIETNDTGG